MGRSFLPAAVILAMSVWAAASSPQLEKARQDAQRVRELVEAGALPRKAIAEAELALAEAEDHAVLERILYGPVALEELTDEQTREMLAAAQRLVDRQETQLNAAKKLVAGGALPASGLAPYEEELARRKAALELANRRAELFGELAEIVRAEEELARKLETSVESPAELASRYEGSGSFLPSQLAVVRLSFEREFGQPLPVSANGATALHRSLGFDHRGRVDVALHPDSAEGRWLLRFLQELQVPYFAFRSQQPGKSTGAHIHVGPPSLRLRTTD